MRNCDRLLPVAVVIPTLNRAGPLRKTLQSFAKQFAQPEEIIVVDASDDCLTRTLCLSERVAGLRSVVRWVLAEDRGAAIQRTQGFRLVTQEVVGFCDDDIVFEPMCLSRLWEALNSDAELGGVNAMITNQQYRTPGMISRIVFCLMAGRRERSYAGRVLGPAVNLLPEDRDELPEVVNVEWLNLTCTVYRRSALPDPLFPRIFRGYSLMEDLALSLYTGKKWKLGNVRMARIFHDSQPGAHKSDPGKLAEMHLENRHFVMSRILRRTKVIDYMKLVVWLGFSHVSNIVNGTSWSVQTARLAGELRAMLRILLGRSCENL